MNHNHVMKNLLIVVFLAPLIASANNWKVALGGIATTQNVKRGMITYKGHQVVPIYSVEKEGLPFLLAGTSFYYRREVSENIILRSRIRFNATGDRPSYFTETDESETIKRDHSTEWDIYLEHLTQDHYYRLEVSRDLTSHESHYYELHLRQAVYNYKRPGMKAVIQPSIFASVGYADRAHNQYLYGNSAVSGLNNYEVGLIIASPNVIDPFFPTLKLSYFEILGDENRSAGYVEDKSGISFELLLAFRVY